jgi:hypothetical protein
MKDLPSECHKLESVRAILLQRRSTASKVDPFEGMSGAHKSRGAYSQGKETHAQLQRRLTTHGTIGSRQFSKLEK